MKVAEQILLLLWLILALQGIVLLYLLGRLHSLKGAAASWLPDIPVTTPEGQVVPLVSQLSATTLLCFVANGCPFCRQVVPDLEALDARYPFVRVQSLVAGRPGDAAAFASLTGTHLPVLAVAPEHMVDRLQVTENPYGFLVDHKQLIQWRGRLSKQAIAQWFVPATEFSHAAPSAQ